MRTVILFVCACLILPQLTAATEYQEVVSSFDNDFYKIDTKNILIRTQYCMEDVTSQEVMLTMDGASGEIVFSESQNSCTVTAVYSTGGYAAGNYRVDISRIEENWYKVSEQDIFIRTEDCLIYAAEQEAMLSVSTVGKGGGGSLHFEREACKVVGLYTPMEL